MKMLLPSRTPLKGSQGPQESLDHTLKRTALENSCTCAPGDMYKNSLIPQIFIKHLPCTSIVLDIVNVLSRQNHTEKTKSLPTRSLHCNWQHAH